MFNKQVAIPTDLENEIARVHSKLEKLEPNDAEYETVVKRLVILYGLTPKKEKLFSGDALLGAGVNLVSVLLILNFERLGVVTSKAFSWVKPRSITNN